MSRGRGSESGMSNEERVGLIVSSCVVARCTGMRTVHNVAKNCLVPPQHLPLVKPLFALFGPSSGVIPVFLAAVFDKARFPRKAQDALYPRYTSLTLAGGYEPGFEAWSCRIVHKGGGGPFSRKATLLHSEVCVIEWQPSNEC